MLSGNGQLTILVVVRSRLIPGWVGLEKGLGRVEERGG